MKIFRNSVMIVFFFLLSIETLAQLDLPRVSPKASIMQNIGITKVEIKYNRPAVKGRTIWGDLVPYNKVWRAGANEATSIEFSTDVTIDGNIVPKGKYSLFTIPMEDKWTIILNKVWDQWGLDYDKHADSDLLRFEVKPQKGPFFERMLFYFSNTSQSEATLNLAWENLNISFNIKSHLTSADDKRARLSPAASVYQRVGIADFTLTFGSPAVKNRTIWGKLVPYNKIWRAGANEATTIEFSTEVTVNGNRIPAGKYALFTIPGEKEWTIIFNKKWNQWGLDYEKNKSEDLIHFKVVPEKNDFNERLFYNFSDLTDNSVTVSLLWEYLKVSFRIDIDLEKQVLKHITEAIEKADNNNWHIYLDAANYGADNNICNDYLLKWIDKSLDIKETYRGHFTKAKILFNFKRYPEALTQIEKCRDLGQSEDGYINFVSQVDNLERKIRNNR